LETKIPTLSIEADSWNEIEQYAKEKADFLPTFLDLPNAVPSHNTFNRVFSAIDVGQLKARAMCDVNSNRLYSVLDFNVDSSSSIQFCPST